MNTENSNGLARIVETIIGASKTIAENPISFVAGFFCVLFFIWQYWGRDDCEYWKTQYEVEREKNNRLHNALLIRNGIINNLQIEKNYQDSIIKDMTYDSTINILENEILQ